VLPERRALRAREDDAVVLAVVDLDPAVVDLNGCTDVLRRLPRPQQRTRDHPVDTLQHLADRRRLGHADVVERRVEPADETAAGVEGGAAVADEDEHAPSRSHFRRTDVPFAKRAGVDLDRRSRSAAMPTPGWPARSARAPG